MLTRQSGSHPQAKTKSRVRTGWAAPASGRTSTVGKPGSDGGHVVNLHTVSKPTQEALKPSVEVCRNDERTNNTHTSSMQATKQLTNRSYQPAQMSVSHFADDLVKLAVIYDSHGSGGCKMDNKQNLQQAACTHSLLYDSMLKGEEISFQQLARLKHRDDIWVSRFQQTDEGPDRNCLRALILAQTQYLATQVSFTTWVCEQLGTTASSIGQNEIHSRVPPLRRKTSASRCEITVSSGDVLDAARQCLRRGLRPCVVSSPALGTQMEPSTRTVACRALPMRDWGSAPAEFQAFYSPLVAVVRGGEACGYPLLAQPFGVAVCTVAPYVQPSVIKRHTTGIGFRDRLRPQNELGTKEKIRVILRLCATKGHDAVIFPPLGCSAPYLVPSEQVSEIFLAVLREPEFDGYFRAVEFVVSCLDSAVVRDCFGSFTYLS